MRKLYERANGDYMNIKRSAVNKSHKFSNSLEQSRHERIGFVTIEKYISKLHPPLQFINILSEIQQYY